MSYRAFKRLLGETSLERKCRFLFGAFILLLITASFWLYARQTEHLAYDQIRTACRLLVSQIMDVQLATGCHPVGPDLGVEEEERKKDEDKNRMAAALDEFRAKWESHWPATALKDYTIWTLKLNAKRQEQMASPEDV
ncbi:MAG TPA: hypothetical protein VFE78_22510, partial [Gemmataceae bacterium]|nr:hypothetical protein [Gemmataceae bacterium]